MAGSNPLKLVILSEKLKSSTGKLESNLLSRFPLHSCKKSKYILHKDVTWKKCGLKKLKILSVIYFFNQTGLKILNTMKRHKWAYKT